MFSRLKRGTKQLLGLGYEALQPHIEPIMKPLRETRQEIGRVLDRQKVLIGYRIDKTVGDVLKGTAELFRPNYSTVTEWKRGWAKKHAPFTEDKQPPDTESRFFVLDKLRKGMNAIYHWGDEMDRTPVKLTSDEDIMAHEEQSYHSNRSDIEQEENIPPIEREPSDHLIQKQLLHHLNKNRSLPLMSFPPNHQISQLAQQRASFYLANPMATTAPLHQLFYKAQQRQIQKKSFAEMTPSDHAMADDSETQVDGSFVYKMPQDAEEYASQARSRQKKAYQMTYEEFSTIFDLEEDTYPSNAQFQQALDKALQRDSFRQMVQRNDVRMAFGFCRQGTKAALTCIALVDPTLHVESRPLSEEEKISNTDDWWFQQIPESERGDGSIWSEVLSKVGGYSSYILYEFFQNIRQLDIDYPTDLNECTVKTFPNLFGTPRQTFKFPITVNGTKEFLHLISGTDKVVTSPGSASSGAHEDALDDQDKKKKKKHKGEVMTARDYIERVKDRLQAHELPITPNP